MEEEIREQITACMEEARRHLEEELLPFWLERCVDYECGGFLTHFGENGDPSGETDKSLISQARTVYTMASAHRAGYGGGACADAARHGVDFLVQKMWDEEHGGFFWICDRTGRAHKYDKIVYGQSFAIYALGEAFLALGDPGGLEFAERTFDLLDEHAWDHEFGGYFEMFGQSWTRAGPGSAGGDRKTLDVHMHLMEAFTTLFECSKKKRHRDRLRGIIEILIEKMLHPEYGTGIPQFTPDWRAASPIKFDIIWGWDRFPEKDKNGPGSIFHEKIDPGPKALDNTSFGHNVELAWLLWRALDILEADKAKYRGVVKKLLDHAVENGIDPEFGGVYVEGPHKGGVYDAQKEFWQQAEMLIGLLDGCRIFGTEKYWPPYLNVHRFVFDKMIHHSVGEWRPLLTREGKPVWTHMSHAWKVNYHTVRSMIQSILRMRELLAKEIG